MRALREISDQLSDRSGVVVHEVVADGSVWYGKDSRHTNADGTVSYDFNTDEIVKFPGAVALIWRWTGDDGFRDEMLDFTWRDLEYVRYEARRGRRRLARGQRQRRAPGHGRGEARQHRLLHPRPVRLRRHGAVGRPERPRRTQPRRAPTSLAARFEDEWWIEADQQYADSLDERRRRQGQPEALDRRRPDGGRALPRRRVRARAGRLRARLARRSPRARTTATAASGRATAACSTPAAAAARPGRRVRDLLAQQRHPGRRRGQLRPPRRGAAAALHGRQRGDPVLRARDRRHAGRAAGRDAGDHAVQPAPGAPASRGTPPNIDRCWTCRSMFMQAWGHYGTAWAAVHQQLGVRPQLGHDWLEVVPQVPTGQPSVEGENIRLGDGAADVLRRPRGQPLHDHDGHARRGDPAVSGSATRCRAARRSRRSSWTARRSTDYESRETNRGLEVRVARERRTGSHTLVVIAG